MAKTWQDHGKEWLDTLVVAISVAMCFRAYFYQPFNIPTGSMQETLWGYHTRENVEKGTWDTFPLSLLKKIWTGETYVEYQAPVSGYVYANPRNDGFADIFVGEGQHLKPVGKLPSETARALVGTRVRKGETFWQGAVVSGDFIFVNRWLWNFRQPRNGDVMVFSTTGIEKLQQGTHYIKRLKARPGETYVLEHPVAGYPTEVTMGADEYFACGDNYNNSFDSRYWGNVPGANLRGVGTHVFWPFKGWRTIQ